MLKVKLFQFEDSDIDVIAYALEHYENELRKDKEHLESCACNNNNDALIIQARICDVTRIQQFLLED